MYESDDSPRPHYYLAQLETIDGQDWTSLHLNHEDAKRKLRVVAEAWGVGFTLDGEPADGFRSDGIDRLPVLSSEQSNEPPAEEVGIPITRHEYGASALASDSRARRRVGPRDGRRRRLTSEVAALRLAGITVLGIAYKVTSGRYRRGSKDG